MDQAEPLLKRQWLYGALSIALVVIYWLVSQTLWAGNTELHSLMEVVATMLAIVVGPIALVHYYSKKNNQFLFIGSAFIGTALLDGYHMVVTSDLFAIHSPSFWPSAPPTLIPWSWNASRIFLSLMLLLSYLMQKREDRLGEAGRIRPALVFGVTGLLTFATFIFFMFYPLPPAYYEGPMFGRPEEFVGALFFGLALIGYWRKGRWRHEAFESWLMLALIASVFTQALFMSRSFQIYDGMFDVAHLLKIISYGFVFTGLLIDTSQTYNRAKLTTRLTEMYETLNLEVIRRRSADKKLKEANLTLEQRVHDRTLELEQNQVALQAINAELEKIKITLDEHSIISMADPSGDITFVNEKFCEISGYSREELIGQNHSIIQSGEHPPEFYRQMWETISGGDTWQGVFKNRTKDGNPYWVDATIAPFRSIDGRIEKYVAIRTDITALMEQGEQLRHQRGELISVNHRLETTNEKLVTTNRELDQFVHTASHDLKSPLVTILGYIGHLRHDVDADRTDRIMKFTDRIEKAAQRMRQNIDDLLELSRVGKMSQGRETLDMNLLVREVSLPLVEQYPNVQLQIDDDLPSIYADQALMVQIMDNLVSNALKYGCTDEQPRIQIGGHLTENEACYFVRDNGQGIAPAYHEKVFGLFQRLGSDGDGTGVGLALVKRAVEVFGGRVWIESEDGDGACFWFAAPLVEPGTSEGANSEQTLGNSS